MRFPISVRLTSLLVAVAALSLGLAFFVQDRFLRENLEAAARARLEGSAGAAEWLIEDHLQMLTRRWTAVSRTPEFRANLEIAHASNLVALAERLRTRDGAAAVLFVLPDGEPIARAGPAEAVDAVLARWREDRRDVGRATVLGLAGSPVATLAVPLHTGARHVGTLLLAEPLRDSQLDQWSEVAGARLVFTRASGHPEGGLARRVRRFGEWELCVQSSFDREQQALDHARHVAWVVGSLALALAALLSVLLARSFVAPIRRIQRATERVGRGDLELRLGIRRNDEIGDVAWAFDATLERLRRSRTRLRTVQRIARFADWSLSGDSQVLEGSPELRSLLAIPEDDAARDDAGTELTLQHLVDRAHPGDRDAMTRDFEACRAQGRPLEMDLRLATPSGIRIFHLQGRRVERDGASVIEGSLQDVTERREAEEQIRHLALHDPLTGLGNRRFFSQRLQLALSDKDACFAVCFVDLDRFKRVNDTLGHSIGDELLRETASRLLAAVRDKPRAAVARVGGDEFTVLLPTARRSDLAALGARMLDAVQGPALVQGQEVSVSASIGIARSPEHGTSAEELLRSCDTALHAAKAEGRSSFRVFDVSMREASERRWTVESGLRQAIHRGDLRVRYQPRVQAETGRIVGFEALLRWKDENLGSLSPEEFVPVAEETGLIGELGIWVFERVLEDYKDWSLSGNAPERVSLNVSGRQLRPGFAESVRTLLAASDVDPTRVEMEVTESAVIDEEDTAVEVIAELRSLGLRIALDDFGTGYSSLSHLRNLPIDVLKIDRAFVRQAPTRPDDAALISAIVAMAKTLRLEVVAEGVETRRQWDTLAELGCDELQGFFFGEAVPADEVPRLIRAGGLPTSKRRTRA